MQKIFKVFIGEFFDVAVKSRLPQSFSGRARADDGSARAETSRSMSMGAR